MISRRLVFILTSLILALSIGLSACGGNGLFSATSTPTELPQPTQPPQPTPTHVPTPTPVLFLPKYLPAALRDAVILPSGWNQSDDTAQASVRLDVGGENVASQWIYALVAPFPTIPNGVTSDELHSAWAGSPPLNFDAPLLMDENTLGVFSVLWGEPAKEAVRVVPTDQLLDEGWKQSPAWAIIPFEQVAPRWKVLEVDGQSPIRNNFDLSNYPLTVPFSFSGPAFEIPQTNRDPNKLTVVAMTGVTALVRATAFEMEQKGVLYPGEEVRDILRSADITHISNEVAFDPNCKHPDPGNPALVFCSDPKYIALLEDMGTDVVESTGDHFIDTPPEAMLFTLDLYRQHGWLYYGGGRNLTEALSPAKFTHNGNKIAFIGCNAKGPGYALASADKPGAGRCGFDELHKEIESLKKEGYLVIVSFSHMEYYSYTVMPQYRPDFTGMMDAGATIVQGSQAHQTQMMEFYDNGLIAYGLGNLFFDQVLEKGGDGLPLDRALIDRHVFYDGRYVSTELIPIKFLDFARIRPMTAEESAPFLQTLFKASGWLNPPVTPTPNP